MELLKRSRWYVVALLGTLYIVSYLDRLILALLVEPLKADLHITDTQFALLIGPVFAFFYAALGLPVAWITDRWNRTLSAVLGIVVWSLSTIAAGFAQNFETLLVLRLGVAFGEAVLSPVAVSLIADHFHKHERATPMAAFVCCGVLGVMAAYSIGGAVVAMVESGMFAHWPIIGGMAMWRVALILIGIPGLILATLLLFTTREPKRGRLDVSTTDGGEAVVSSSGAFETPRQAATFYVLFFLGSSTVMMTGFAALAFFPTHLVRVFGIGIAESGYLFSIALAVAAAVLLSIPFACSWFAKRGRPDMLIPIELTLLPIGSVLFGFALVQTDLQMTTLLTIGGMGLMSGINGLQSIAVAQTAPAAYRGRLMAVNLAASNVIGLGGGPFVAAWLADNLFDGPRALAQGILALMCVAAPLGWLLIFLSWKPYRVAMSRA